MTNVNISGLIRELSKNRTPEASVAIDVIKQLEKELAELKAQPHYTETEIYQRGRDDEDKYQHHLRVELQAELENAIVPRFKIGQEVWILEGDYSSPKPSIECLSAEKYKVVKIEVSYSLDNDTGYIHEPEFDQFIFATRAEAQASLKTEGAE
jgi:hypothetical protein